MSDFGITDNERRLLQDMLGATSQYPQDQWGFRNGFLTTLGSEDCENLLAMAQGGLVMCNRACTLFSSTRKGALAIGLKPYQIKKLKFAED